MAEQEIIVCPKCKQRLRMTSGEGILGIQCPTCGEKFLWDNRIGAFSEDALTRALSKSKSSNTAAKWILVSAGLVLLGLILYLNNEKKDIVPSPLSKSRTEWVTIDYANLVDFDAIIRTGQSLKSALRDSHLKGAIQPFLDHYSYLLQPSVEMLRGPDLTPQHNVVDHFPVGSKQPAWVAVFRGGRVFVTTDNKNHARVFLLGEKPKEAYNHNYLAIRHCLAGLLPDDGSNLVVEVYAYKNNYKKCELALNPEPYLYETSAFPASADTIPLDLFGLKEFFEKGGQLEGARLDKRDGLILYAKQGTKRTVAGRAVSLADFAVAYRAVFHAGDNEAFISLDPHKDPTKVTVNFGGFLEDTSIGAVVLEADKRFKTITSGLDPNSFKDLRSHTRQYLPTFLTVSEREMLTDPLKTEEGKWIGTRFWFYPESIEIESDFNYEYAKIIKPYFQDTLPPGNSSDTFGVI